METLMKCAALATAGALVNVAVRRGGGEFPILIGVAVAAMIGALTIELLGPVVSFARTLGDRAGLSTGLIAPVLKTLAIGFLTDAGGQICRDAGESGMAAALQAAGTAAAFYVLLPLIQSLLELMEGML